MHRATAVVGGCYGASRDDGGSDQGSVVVRVQQVQAAVEARVTTEARRGKQKGVQSQNPSPPLIGLLG